MSIKTILFVDDEPNILSGIKRMMRPLREQFTLHFAENGQQALEVMAENEINIVVSDMRMPVMDGAAFFVRAREDYPNAIRIMLTGQADDESVMKSVSVVHQFLTKPCAPETLKEVLTRSAALLDLMANDQLKNVVSGIDTLPSLPNVYAQLQEVLQNKEAGPGQVADVIEQDVAMSAKLMQLVNSSFFGLYSKVESIDRAVKLLGLDTIRILVLGLQIFDEMRPPPTLISIDYLWQHSIAVAQCSRKIAQDTTDNTDLINYCFLSGLLHDIGRLLLLSKLPQEYEPIIRAAQAENKALLIEEHKGLQATHCDVGAYLVGLWGFNSDVVEAIAFHNSPERYPATSFTAALSVHVADALYYKHLPEEAIGEIPQLNQEYLVSLGFQDKLDSWSELCEIELDKLAGNN